MALITVEVVYALPTGQQLVACEVEEGTTAIQAVYQSGVLGCLVNQETSAMKLGIFGKAVSHDVLLRERDRVEVYRPLLADPKVIRQRRALAAQARRR
jgi:putative ubiquitin-RnfH superfamily antitoxin RatB of RatAB toxin-antitoxin module